MGVGDEILAAGQAQRLFEADPWDRIVRIYDTHDRHRWHDIWDGNPIIAPPGDTRPFQKLVNAKYARPYIVYPFTAETGWTFNRAFHARDHIARIYLTEAEVELGYQVLAQTGPYVLIEPYSKHGNLRWPMASWQQLIDRRTDLTFVQHIHEDSQVLDGVLPVRATFREACGLVASSRLYVRGESGMCHATAALGRPQVTIWGGCMEWDVLGGYPGQLGLLRPPYCGSYQPCPHCQAAMASITVPEVSAAIDTALVGVP